jgi:hypothetical protein
LLQGLTVTGSQQWGNNDGVDFESGSNIQVHDKFVYFVAFEPKTATVFFPAPLASTGS